jgi:hypothetical protein
VRFRRHHCRPTDHEPLDVCRIVAQRARQHFDHAWGQFDGRVRYRRMAVRAAQAHTSAGVPTITGAVRGLGYPMLAGWAPVGDFEGVVTVAVA